MCQFHERREFEPLHSYYEHNTNGLMTEAELERIVREVEELENQLEYLRNGRAIVLICLICFNMFYVLCNMF